MKRRTDKMKTAAGVGAEQTYFFTVLKIALPVALQSMLQSSFSMIDQMMVGRLGSTAIAAVEAAGRPAFVYSVVLGAVAAIAGIQIAQYLGQNDLRAADTALCVNLSVAIVIALVFSAICFFIPGRMVGIFTTDAAIIREGEGYLRIIAGTYLPLAVSTIVSVMLRCMDAAVFPMASGFAAAGVNTLLNYMLIFGRLGMPALGIRGAAMASVISQLAQMVLIGGAFLILIRQRNAGAVTDSGAIVQGTKKSAWMGHFHFSIRMGREKRHAYIGMLAPICCNEFLWSIGQNVNTFIYGHIGTAELAAMAMTGPVQGLFIGAMSGVAQAAGILIGKRLGEKRYDAAYAESKRLLRYGLYGSLVLSAALIVFAVPYTRLFAVEREVADMVVHLLRIFAVLAPVKVANMVLGGGIVRSGGKTTYIMVIDTFGTWGIGVPVGLITAFVLHLPVSWVYFLLSMEEVVRFGITWRLFTGRRWMETI